MNPLLARLQHEVVHVAADRARWTESCLNALMTHERAADLTAPSDIRMASSEDDGFWPPKDDWRANFRPYVVKNGVLLIPVFGVLLNKFPWQAGSWATGYTYIARALQRGLADEEVKKIAFLCDSPGGEASGNFELGDIIYNARGQKPMQAFADDRAYSAAYLIACSTNSITMTRTGGVGSIGAYAMHVDVSKALEQDGIKITFIKFGERKTDGNPYEKLSARAKLRIQERIDRLGNLFVEAVARNRGLEEQVVRDTEADCFGAEEALELGLADKVEVFENALIAFTEDTSDSGDDEMTTQATASGAKVITQADLDAAVAAATETARTTALAEANTAANSAAKARMTAILASEPAKKRQKAAMSVALNTDLTVEQASTFLLSLDEETSPAPAATTQAGGATGALFAAAMNGGQHPEVGAGDAATQGQGNADDELAAQILRDHNLATGYSAPKQKAA